MPTTSASPDAPLWSLAAHVAATWPGAGTPPRPSPAGLQAAIQRASDPPLEDTIASWTQADPHRWERNPELAVADMRDFYRRVRPYAIGLTDREGEIRRRMQTWTAEVEAAWDATGRDEAALPGIIRRLRYRTAAEYRDSPEREARLSSVELEPRYQPHADRARP